MRTTVPPRIDSSSLKTGLNPRPGQLAHTGHQLCALLRAQFARRHNLRLPNAQPLLQLRALRRGHFMHLADAIVVDQHRQQVAQLLLQTQLRVQLVEDRHLLRRREPPD